MTIAGRVAEHFARTATAETSPDVLVGLKDANPRVADAIVAGLAKGWPKDKKPTLDPATDQALVDLLTKLSPAARAQLVSLAGRWGSKAIEASSAEVVTTFLATARDEKQPEAARVDAARRLIEFRPLDAQVAESILSMISPRAPQGLAIGLVDAAGKSEAPEVGPALVARLGSMTPAVRSEAAKALLSRPEWTSAYLIGVEKGDASLSQLSLAQTQSLAAHPDKALAARAKVLIAKGGGLPDLDRQKVIDQLAPVVLKGGDPSKGKLVFAQQCAKCHMHGGEGGKVGPDLTGMGTHPREELLIHILDPSRSVEGNFVQYTLATTGGQVFNGLLASESRSAVELTDAEGQAAPGSPRGDRGLRRLEKVADARRVREAGDARRDGRPVGVPHQAWQVPADRPPAGQHGGDHTRDVLQLRVADRAVDLPRLVAQDLPGRPVPAGRPARETRSPTRSCSTAPPARIRRRCPSRSPSPSTPRPRRSTSSAGSAVGGRPAPTPSSRRP